MIIKFKKTDITAKMPARGSACAAGYDLFITDPELKLLPGETVKAHTGIAVAIPNGYVGLVFARSGMATAYGLRPANCVGVIDSDYYGSDNEGHIQAKITNDSREGKELKLEAGTGFMQGIFLEYGITEDDDADEIRNGGFGSTTAQGK